MNQQPIPMVIESTLLLVRSVYRMAGNAKANQEHCQELAKRVRSLEKMLIRIQQRGQDQISLSLEDTLRELYDTLQSTEEWMMKYTQSKRKSFKSSSHDEKFRKLDKGLSGIFQALSVALLDERGENVDMMHSNLMRRGSILSRQGAPIHSLSFPQPTPAPQPFMPSGPPVPLGPYGFSMDLSYGPFGQSSMFNPGMPQPMPPLSMDFSNNTIGNPPSMPPVVNFPSMTPMINIPQFSSVDFPESDQ